VTYEELLELARRHAGETLATVPGKRFTVGVSDAEHCPFFTPESSGYGQTDGRKAAERFLARYNETRSLRPGDYADVTRNASYYVGLLLHAQDR
jgi:ribosomal protein L31